MVNFESTAVISEKNGANAVSGPERHFSSRAVMGAIYELTDPINIVCEPVLKFFSQNRVDRNFFRMKACNFFRATGSAMIKNFISIDY
jgi:hypothetical protein